MRRATALNKQEEDAQLLYIMVFASLLSLHDSMLRNFYMERKQRLLPAGRYASAQPAGEFAGDRQISYKTKRA